MEGFGVKLGKTCMVKVHVMGESGGCKALGVGAEQHRARSPA